MRLILHKNTKNNMYEEIHDTDIPKNCEDIGDYINSKVRAFCKRNRVKDCHLKLNAKVTLEKPSRTMGALFG